MKIVALLKKVPDTDAKIKLNSDRTAIDYADTKFIMNPYDEFGIEEALRIKEKNGGTPEVVVISLGAPDVKELIIKGLAMGADRGLLIDQTGLEGLDGLGVAKILSAAIKAENPDLVLAGRHAIDDDNMSVTAMIAELLGWPHVNVIGKLEMQSGSARAERSIEGGQVEVYDVKLPAIFGADKALNQPRFAQVAGIMKARKKPLDSKSVSDFGLDAAGLKSKYGLSFGGFSYPPEKPAAKIFKGEPIPDMVAKLAQALREEAKVL